MSIQDPQDRDLIHTIQATWVPRAPDVRAFDARLHARLRDRQRRRVVASAVAVAALLLVVASHLLGGPEPGPSKLVELTPPEPTPAVASAPSPAFFSQALDHDQRGFSLPGAYGALDTLFLQTADQEL
jgi:hypothetical protein